MTKLTKIVRRVENDRIVYYSQVADESYWFEQWKRRLQRGEYDNALRGRFEYLDTIFHQWLPRDAPILEAGCGRGNLLVALRENGWQAEGVDFSVETINALKGLFPDLPLRWEDVTSLAVPDNYYGGYISIGVIEHRREGPQPFLDEAYRVLRPGGIAVITVPYINPIRRYKMRLGFYQGAPPDVPFYQYAFSEGEFRQFVEEAGFEVVARQPYGGYKGIIDELYFLRPPLGVLKKAPLVGPPVTRWLSHCRYGHMLALVCRKPP